MVLFGSSQAKEGKVSEGKEGETWRREFRDSELGDRADTSERPAHRRQRASQATRPIDHRTLQRRQQRPRR